MSNCIVCNQDVDEYTISLHIKGRANPSNRIEVLANVCPNCGVMRLPGSDIPYMALLDSGFPDATEEDLASIDLNAIFNEMVVPGKDYGEQIKWIAVEDIDPGYDEYYNDLFKDGLPTFGKYKRLVHMLKMDQADRVKAFGPFRCTSLRLAPNGGFIFREGRSRFLLFKYMGALRIPVSISAEYMAIAEHVGLTLYDSKE